MLMDERQARPKSKSIRTSRTPRDGSPVDNYSFKPAINPNSQKIIERLKALQPQKDQKPLRIEESLLQRQKMALAKPQSPLKSAISSKNLSRSPMPKTADKSASKPFASKSEVDAFYLKRKTIRA